MTDQSRSMTAIAIIEEDALTLSQMVHALEGLSNVAPYNSVDEVLASRSPSLFQLVLVLGPSQTDEDTLKRVGEIVRAEPGTGALLVVSSPDAAVLRPALRAGLDDAVPLARVRDDLVPAIRDLERRLEAATASLRDVKRSTVETARGRIVAVFSPKGGVGRSVIAVNLAVAFARRTRRRVVLIDTDPQFGDACVMLRLTPVHTLADAVAAGDRLDPLLLESLLTRDDRTGVEVLAAPTDPTSPSGLTPKAVSFVLEVLREMGALAIIDTPRVLDDVVLQTLSESDDIVFVVGMDIPSIKNARLSLQALELVQIPLSHVLLVLNRADSRVQLSTRDVEKILEMKFDFALPSDALVPKSVNRGAPAVLERSRFASEIQDMAERLLANAAEQRS